MKHRSFSREIGGRENNLEDLRAVVASDIIDGAKIASEAFRKAGVPHVLVGGLAVGVRGYPRGTKDIDFMVGDEAFDFQGPIVSPKAGLPIRYKDKDIDWVSVEEKKRSCLEEFLIIPDEGTVPTMPVHALIYMKIIAGRKKDLADVVELIKAGADTKLTFQFIEKNAPGLIDRFADACKSADIESEE